VIGNTRLPASRAGFSTFAAKFRLPLFRAEILRTPELLLRVFGPEFPGIARERAGDLIHDGVRLWLKRFPRRSGQGVVHLDDGQATVALPARYCAAAVAKAPAHDDAGGASQPFKPDRVADTPRSGGTSVPHAEENGVAARV